jgi:hypothetical protein
MKSKDWTKTEASEDALKRMAEVLRNDNVVRKGKKKRKCQDEVPFD